MAQNLEMSPNNKPSSPKIVKIQQKQYYNINKSEGITDPQCFLSVHHITIAETKTDAVGRGQRRRNKILVIVRRREIGREAEATSTGKSLFVGVYHGVRIVVRLNEREATGRGITLFKTFVNRKPRSDSVGVALHGESDNGTGGRKHIARAIAFDKELVCAASG